MTTTIGNRSDLAVRDAVLQQLAWDSQVDAAGIGVTADCGSVTLTGFIGTYAGKLAAERAAKRVRGVRAVANDLHVRLRYPRDDSEIAVDAAGALGLRTALPETVQAVVRNGYVTLTGTVHTLFQRAVAENAIRHVRGVRGIVNRIAVAPVATERDVKRGIVRALHREADIDARGIQVHVMDDVVTLAGEVRSWHEREAAERAAMHAPGITRVDNRVTVACVEEEPGGPELADEEC